MSNIPAVIPSSGDLSGFLAKRERIVGNIFGVAIGIGGVMLLGPYVLGALSLLNGIFNEAAALAIKTLLVSAAVMICMNKTVRAQFWYLRVMVSRWLTMTMIKVAPTYLLQAYGDEYLTGEHRRFIGDMSFIKGLSNQATERKEKNREERKGLFDKSQVLYRRSYDTTGKRWTNEEDQMNYNLFSQKIGMLDKLYAKLVNQEQRLDMMCKIIEKFERAFRYQIAMIQAMVQSLTTEYESERALAEATQRMGALTSDNPQRQIFLMTKSFMEEQIGQFKAVTDTFIRVAPDLLSEPELEGEIASQRVMEEIQGWDKRISTVLTQVEDSTRLIGEGKVIDMIMTSPTTAEPLPIPASSKKKRSYPGLG